MMRNATKRMQRVMIGLMAILSLTVASVASCACTHHRQEAEPTKSCHSAAVPHGHAPAANNSPSLDESCICVQPAIRLSVKSEGFKFKKHAAVFLTRSDIQPGRFRAPVIALALDLQSAIDESRFSPTTSSRGPPVS